MLCPPHSHAYCVARSILATLIFNVLAVLRRSDTSVPPSRPSLERGPSPRVPIAPELETRRTAIMRCERPAQAWRNFACDLFTDLYNLFSPSPLVLVLACIAHLRNSTRHNGKDRVQARKQGWPSGSLEN